MAGRTCYKSEDKITQDSAEKFVKMIVGSGHCSVIEHVNLTIKFITDRGVLAELSRHRLASLSVESTRYCNYNKKGFTFIIPPWTKFEAGEYYRKEVEGIPYDYQYKFNNEHLNEIEYPYWDFIWLNSMFDTEERYQELVEDGEWQPQQARSILPNSLKTEVVMTCNLRELRHILSLRTSKAAHPQIRQIMFPLLNELQSKLPLIFGDIDD